MDINKRKVALITGDSSGFGFEIAKLFIKHNYIVYGISKSEFNYENINHYICDISNFELCEKTINEIIKNCGHIDVLVNNAGFGISGAVETTCVDAAHRIFDVNFFGAFNMAKCLVPFMREQKFGRIINISSIGSAVALPFQAFYSASKSAVDTLFTAMQGEVFKYNIKITSIMPGDAKTNFTKARLKTEVSKESPYFESYIKSINQMEKDEQNGFAPIKVANAVLKVANSKHPPLTKVVGFKDGALYLLFKFLPKRIRYWAVRKVYAK